jgi:chromosomal replication initiation ATPase DnaA
MSNHLSGLPPVVASCFQMIQGEYGVSASELLSHNRPRRIADARMALYAAIYDIRWPSGRRRFSMPAVAEFTKRRHHTTVLHGIRRHAERMGEGA